MYQLNFFKYLLSDFKIINLQIQYTSNMLTQRQVVY